MYKKLIITGCPRTGTTALARLLSLSKNILITNETGFFHPNKNIFLEFFEDIKNINSYSNEKSAINFEILKEKGWNVQLFKEFINMVCKRT